MDKKPSPERDQCVIVTDELIEQNIAEVKVLVTRQSCICMYSPNILTP